VIAYVFFLTIVGAIWTSVPESTPGSPAHETIEFVRVPIAPALVASTAAFLVIVGITESLRAHRWGTSIAALSAVVLTAFGAIYIFGSFGVTFIAGVALLAFIAVFAWFGKDRDPRPA
jgi:hypothetical protein